MCRLLQNNAISGPIPAAIGKLEKLHTLDLSNNTFSGEMPTSLGNLKNLNYLCVSNLIITLISSADAACFEFFFFLIRIDA